MGKSHRLLLDAAHIVPDGEPCGDPRVPNGLALCKLHHAAFDRLFVGVRPDGVIEVRRDILEIAVKDGFDFNAGCGVSCASRRGHGRFKRRWRATPSDSRSPPSSRQGP